MSILEFAVCRTRPTVTEMDDLFMIAYQRDTTLTAMVAEQTWKSCEKVGDQISQFVEKRFELEWRLPDNVDEAAKIPQKRIIEYLGVPVRYSKIRFAIMVALIIAKGKHVPYEQVSRAGWGAVIDDEVLVDAIYHLNQFLKSVGIPKFVHCDSREIYIDSNFPPSWEQGNSKNEKKRKNV